MRERFSKSDGYCQYTTQVNIYHLAHLSPREIFGGNLRRLRRLKDLSQEDLALAADLSRVHVSEVERGLRNVSIDNMAQLADALGVELKDLVDPDMFQAMQKRIG